MSEKPRVKEHRIETFEDVVTELVLRKLIDEYELEDETGKKYRIVKKVKK